MAIVGDGLVGEALALGMELRSGPSVEVQKGIASVCLCSRRLSPERAGSLLIGILILLGDCA